MLELQFAQEFGLPPWEVRSRTPVVWWERWLVWRKTSSARDLFDAMNAGLKKGGLSKDEQALQLWAMTKDKR